MKRFYKQVSVAPEPNSSGFSILLDGRPMRTQGGLPLLAPTEGLAKAVAAEWDAQVDKIVPNAMPLTSLLTTALERTIPERASINLSVLEYLNGDLLCYRSSAGVDSGLDIEEERVWGPWLEWFAGRFGHKLSTTTDIAAIYQSDDAHGDMATYLSGLDDHTFNILQIVTSMSGSFVLALAFIEGLIEPQQIFEAAQCEELYFIRLHDLEDYGHDPITTKKYAGLMRDFEACKEYLNLI